MPELAHKKTADMVQDGVHYSSVDPYYTLGPVHTSLYVRVRETGDWDLFPVPWNGRGQSLVQLTEGCYSGGFTRMNKVTPVSLGYTPSVFNKNSTLRLWKRVDSLGVSWSISCKFLGVSHVTRHLTRLVNFISSAPYRTRILWKHCAVSALWASHWLSETARAKFGTFCLAYLLQLLLHGCVLNWI